MYIMWWLFIQHLAGLLKNAVDNFINKFAYCGGTSCSFLFGGWLLLLTCVSLVDWLVEFLLQNAVAVDAWYLFIQIFVALCMVVHQAVSCMLIVSLL